VRKSAFGDRPIQTTMLRVPKDVWKAAKLQAVMNDITLSELIARYVTEGLERDRGKR
jgi:predicted HicB family RNase H-like nuclease